LFVRESYCGTHLQPVRLSVEQQHHDEDSWAKHAALEQGREIAGL